MSVDEQHEMVRHAIAKTLVVCAGLAGWRAKRGEILMSIAKDSKHSERAVTLIFNQMLREMVEREESTPKQFQQLLKQLTDLTREA